MLPDWVPNPGPLTYESGALPIALRGPGTGKSKTINFPFVPNGILMVSGAPKLKHCRVYISMHPFYLATFFFIYMFRVSSYHDLVLNTLYHCS